VLDAFDRRDACGQGLIEKVRAGPRLETYTTAPLQKAACNDDLLWPGTGKIVQKLVRPGRPGTVARADQGGERLGIPGRRGSWCSGSIPVERRAVERPSGRCPWDFS
jgi:hypothetical protein